jgi:simple sugar transport system permease protein
MAPVSTSVATQSWLRRCASQPLFWPLLTLVLLLLGNGVFNPGFLALHWRDGHLYGNLVDIGNRAAPLILVSLGMTLVIAVRGLDISVGAVLAMAATVAAWTLSQTQAGNGLWPLALGVVAALVVAALCGLWNGLLVVKIGMQPIVATLILMVAGRGVAQLISGGQIITIYYAPYSFLGNGFLLGLPFPLYVVAAMFIGLHLLLRRSALGLFVGAIGHNPVAAKVAGVRAGAIILATYVFCGFSAGMAGVLVSANVNSADANNAGQLFELDAILAVSLGGTLLNGGRFSLAGSLVGALILQTMTSTIYAVGWPPQLNLVVKAVLVFLVMLLQSAEFRGQVRAWLPRAGKQA